MPSKMIVISILVLIILVAVPAVLYQKYWSFSALLHESGFTESDIVDRDAYAYGDAMIHVLLLANEHELGIVATVRSNWGKWSRIGSSKSDLYAEGNLATFGFSNMHGWGEDAFVDKHVFVAVPLQDNQPIHVREAPFELSIQYLGAGEHTILYAHAVAGGEFASFGSHDVLPYLELP